MSITLSKIGIDEGEFDFFPDNADFVFMAADKRKIGPDHIHPQELKKTKPRECPVAVDPDWQGPGFCFKLDPRIDPPAELRLAYRAQEGKDSRRRKQKATGMGTPVAGQTIQDRTQAN